MLFVLFSKMSVQPSFAIKFFQKIPKKERKNSFFQTTLHRIRAI